MTKYKSVTSRIYPLFLALTALVVWVIPDSALGTDWNAVASVGDVSILVLLAVSLLIWEIRDGAQYVVEQLRDRS